MFVWIVAPSRVKVWRMTAFDWILLAEAAFIAFILVDVYKDFIW